MNALSRLGLASAVTVAFIASNALAQQKGPQEAAPSYKAAADVYKLVAENEHFRVIEATWKPGQRDAWHAHAGQVAAYTLTGCEIRLHTPDGKYVDRTTKKGSASFNPIVASHSLENRSKTECHSILIEKK